MWQKLAEESAGSTARLVSSPGNKVSCNSDHESAFPLSIIHSKKCNSSGLGGNGRKGGIFHDTLGSALLSPHETLRISSQITLRFQKISLSDNLTGSRED